MIAGKLRCGLIAVFATLFWVNVGRADVLPIYPEATTREWESEFHDAVQENYVRLFKPKLDVHEAQQLRSLHFIFPTDPNLVLFQFESRSDGAVILPVASLLLLKDLIAAFVWLEANNYSTQTVLDYLSIVYQGRLGTFPSAERMPLQALGIPADALADQSLLQKRNDILSKSIFFILGHELGHLSQGFSAQADCQKQRSSTSTNARCNFASLQKSEENADAFAVEMFRRIGLVPSASNVFFILSSQLYPKRSEFSSEQVWEDSIKLRTHPLDSVRIENVATRIEAQRQSFQRAFASPELGDRAIDDSVKALKTLAAMLNDKDLTGMQIAWAKTLNAEDIKPRPTHEPRLRPTASDFTAKQPWTGFFTGKANFSNGGNRSLQLILRLQGSGSQISGEVMLGGIRGKLEGRYIDATHAIATWIVAGDTYRLTLVTDETGQHLQASYQSTVDAEKGDWMLEKVSMRQIRAANDYR